MADRSLRPVSEGCSAMHHGQIVEDEDVAWPETYGDSVFAGGVLEEVEGFGLHLCHGREVWRDWEVGDSCESAAGEEEVGGLL